MTLEQKYRRAVQTLQAIAQCTGSQKYRGGYLHDEWTEAWNFIGCSDAANAALVCLGEPTYLPDRKPRHEAEANATGKKPYFQPESKRKPKKDPERSEYSGWFFDRDENDKPCTCPNCGRTARLLLGSYVYCDKCGCRQRLE